MSPPKGTKSLPFLESKFYMFFFLVIVIFYIKNSISINQSNFDIRILSTFNWTTLSLWDDKVELQIPVTILHCIYRIQKPVLSYVTTNNCDWEVIGHQFCPFVSGHQFVLYSSGLNRCSGKSSSFIFKLYFIFIMFTWLSTRRLGMLMFLLKSKSLGWLRDLSNLLRCKSYNLFVELKNIG